MPTLTKNRRNQLSAILQREREKLESALHTELAKQLEEGQDNGFGPSLDSADRSVISLQESLDDQVAGIWQDELRKIAEVERKLDDGTYGFCEICGEEIGEQRLSALPFAIHCVRCAERTEGDDIRGKGPTL